MRVQSTIFKQTQPAFRQIYKLTVAKKCFADDENNAISPNLLGKEQYIREIIKYNMTEEIKKYVLSQGLNVLTDVDGRSKLQKFLQTDFLSNFSVVGEQPLWSNLEDAVEDTFPMEYVTNTINPNIKRPMNKSFDTFYVYSAEHSDILQEIMSESVSDYDKFLKSKEAGKSLNSEIWAFTKKMELIKKKLDEMFAGENESNFIVSSDEALKKMLKIIVEENTKK